MRCMMSRVDGVEGALHAELGRNNQSGFQSMQVLLSLHTRGVYWWFQLLK